MTKILGNAWIDADEHATVRGQSAGKHLKPDLRLAPIVAGLALFAGLAGVGPQAHAATYNPNSCASPKGTGPDGVAYPAGKNPKDGSGLWSNVLGCDADGGGYTGVQVFGFNAAATGNGATALGFAATAAIRSTAVGMQASALAAGATALGQWARATAAGSIAIGGNTSSNTAAAGAQASGAGAVAIAGESRAMGSDSVAIGTQAQARRDGDVAIGIGSVADGATGNFSAVAIGRDSSAIGENSVAFGNANRATGAGAVALGNSSAATGAAALAIGNDANALAARSMALGFDSVATNSGDVALGAGSATAAAVGTSGAAIAGRSYSFAGSAPTSTVSVGSTGAERSITNVAAGRLGALSTDAINGSQLHATNQAVNALGDRAVAYDGNDGEPKGLVTLAGPASTDGGATGGTKLTNLARGAVSAASTDAVNGSQLHETNQDVQRVGDRVTTMGDTVNNLGNTVTNLGDTVTSMGDTVTNLGDTVTSMGDTVTNLGDTVTSMGGTVTTLGDTLTSLGGTLANLTGDTSVAYTDANGLGIRYARTNERGLTPADAYAQNPGSTALGYNARSTADDALALGRDAQASHAGSVALGANAVANGATLAASAYRSGTAAVAGAAPVGEVSIGSAGAERRLTNLAAGASDTDAVNVSQLKSVADNVGSLNDRAVTYDGPSGDPKNLITLAGPASTDGGATGGTKLTNLARGAVSAASTDAVNGSQLHETNQDVQRVGDRVTTMGDTVNNLGNTVTNLGDTVTSMGDTVTNLGDTVTSMGDTVTNLGDTVTNMGGTVTTLGDKLTSLGGTLANLTGDTSVAYTDANGLGIRYARTNERGLAPSDAYAQNPGSSALGYNARATADNALALGRDAQASHAGSVALGANAVANGAALATSAYRSGTAAVAGAAPVGEVSIGSAGAERRLTNLAAGASDTDAVNVSQLKSVADNVGSLGDRAVTYDGKLGDPKSLITLAGAVSADGGATGGTKLTNLARGAVSAASTDAVNGSQLYDINQDVLRMGDTLTTMGDTYTNLAGDNNLISKADKGLGLRYARTNESGMAEDDAYAQGVGSTALGYTARATAGNALALGHDAVASQEGSVALGAGSVSGRALASTTGSLAIGSGGALVPFNTADLTLLGAVSVGHDGAYRQITNVADGTEAHDAVTLRQLTGAIGSLTATGTQYFHANSAASDSLATGLESIAIGPQAVVNGDRGLGIGERAVVDQSAPGGIALGQQARTTSADGIAAGTQALADAVQGVALGAGSRVISGGGVALGAGSIAKVVAGADGYVPLGGDGAAVNATRSKLAALSVGDVDAGNYRQITGVAAGTVDSDAVNVSQLKALASNVTGLEAGGVKYDRNQDGTINYGMVTLNPGGAATVLRNLARGALSAESTDAVNGSQLFETNQYVKSIGDTIDTFTQGGAGIKYFHANGGASAVLPDSLANGLGSIAMGPGAAANGANSVALGNGAAAGKEGDVALGAGAVADRGAESYTGKYSDAKNQSVGTVSVGASGAERTLSNLADGRAATDGVNLRQLDGALRQANDYTDKRLQEVAGNVLQVGDQLTALDERVAGVEGDVTNISNGAAGMFQTSQEEKAAKPPKASGRNSAAGGAGAVASGKNSTAIGNDAQASGAGATALGNGSKASGSNAVALGAGSVADRDNTVSVGAEGAERQIAYVARGTAGTDAVNVNQLREIESGLTNQVAGLRKDVQGLDNRLSAGVASAMAMSALPQAYLPGRSMFSMGGGTWRGESGFAMGLSTVSDSGKWVVKGLASSSSRGDYGASVGVGYQW
ncbi:YadA-like C-terminal domain protein 2 [Achromobacter xylosoxidans A8]|uniref:YadA-like C-terminal domain protein 2 n=1 Tax=Achromobacter xylosoxidans (strain A8) TaxID=762376 RepID=E3HM75_ACHXA|nr:YadA-like family protein [Achromobacter xylosoxidans]ADP15777.1 YadA-like C-terminal domain protein 2 [Achromobacter xylosoxidans A8]